MTDLPIGLLGLGAYLPQRVMTNDEWARYVDTTDEWITARTGIKRRRVAAPEESTADLAVAAARSALEACSLGPGDVDEIIVATDTPEMLVPDTAAFVQHRLGAREVPAYDLAGSGCAGFLLALDIARGRALLRRARVLVVGVEVLTRWLTWKDRSTDVLFGDAAAATVVGAGDGAAEILAAVAGTDGSRSDILCMPVGGTREPLNAAAVAAGVEQHLVMNGREVFRDAVARMTAAAREVLEVAGVSLAEVDVVVPHQANLRIVSAVAARLGLPLERFVINLQDYGNTGSASIPLALWEAQRGGRIRPGQLVLCVSFGAGFHWGAVLIRF